MAENKKADVDSVQRELKQHGVDPEHGADAQVEDEQGRGQQVCEAQTRSPGLDMM